MTKLDYFRLNLLASLGVCLLISSNVCSLPTFQHPKILDDDIIDPSKAASSLIDMAYIIVLSNTTTDVNSTMENLMNMSIKDGGQIRFVFEDAFKGFSVSGMSNARMTQILDNAVVHSATRVSHIVYQTCLLHIWNKFF
jgi:hypothetical protein